MNSVTDALLILVIGILGGVLGHRLRLPSGPLLGSLGAVLLAQAVLPTVPQFDPSIRRWLQILVGTTLGSRVSSESLRRLRQALPVVLLVTGGTLLGAVGGAAVLRLTLRVDLGTALLASTPGGLPEMALLADALGRDVPTVLLIQLLRSILTILVVVSAVRFVTGESVRS